MDRLKQRPSLAKLADRFNTAPPPGYVAGRGRGVSGFSKPDPADLPKGRGARGAGAAGAGSSSAELQATAADAETAGDEHKLKLGADGKLEGDAGDSRELDLSETERFEKQQLSMDSSEAGYKIEAFNMDAERREGHFDDDFNYVWKRKGDDPDDANDAWLGEVDSTGESAEKVEKRRRLLQQQIETQQQPDEPAADRGALLQQILAVVKPGETVAAALRRLSKRHANSGGKRQAAGDVTPSAPLVAGAADGHGDDGNLEEILAKQQFEELTDAADALLRAGRFDIYNRLREALLDEVEALRRAANGAATSSLASAQGAVAGASAQGDEASAAAAVALGIEPQVHDGAVAGGFVLDAAHRVYFNASSGLYFDPRSSLYWSASSASSSQPVIYYVWDAAAAQFVVAPVDGQLSS